MKTFLILTIVQTISLFSYGFILPLDVILEKNILINGSQIIAIEQDVIFKDGGQELVIHESWLIEGDKNLKLVATGVGELKDAVKIVAIYNGKARTTQVGKSRVTDAVAPDFFERYLSVRALGSYKNYLSELGVAPQVRLSRADGAIAFAIGQPSAPSALKPQLWFLQDSFQLRKMRFTSGAEISFTDFAVVNPKLDYPKTKKIEWSGKSVTIKIKSINDKPKVAITQFYPQNVDVPSELVVSNKGALGQLIEDFYKRFR